MSYETIGKEMNCGLKHPMFYCEEAFIKKTPEDECFRLLLIEQGSGDICFRGFSIRFTAPTLLCLNEKDFPLLNNCTDVKIKSIYFYPYLINNLFNYENIRNTENKFSYTERQDSYLLFPFIYRDNYYKGMLFVGYNDFLRESKLFEYIGRELQQQRDMIWPCRSRSYFLELLISITKLFDSKQVISEGKLPDMPISVENVVSYLHNNYQEKITIEQLSTMFSTNRTTLNNQFYKATGLSIIEYLIKLRVNVAATMLRDTLIPISEIMIRVGFNDSTNFWRTFKKNTTLSPKKYRELYCWVKD